MFREMLKKKRETTKDEAYQFLEKAQEGILSTISVDNSYPYGTPVNHVLIDNKIYFHCAVEGHKIDNIRHNNKVSFFAIVSSIVDKESYTTHFESVHVFGKAYIVEDKKEKVKALYELSRKFTGEFFVNVKEKMSGSLDVTGIVRIEIDDIKGKKV